MLRRSNSDPKIKQLQCITEAGLKTKGSRAKLQPYLSRPQNSTHSVKREPQDHEIRLELQAHKGTAYQATTATNEVIS